MHILFIPAWFESPGHPTSGKAVKDLAIALTRSGLQVNILFQSPFKLPDVQTIEEGIFLFHSKYQYGGKLIPVLNSISLYLFLNVFKKYIDQKGRPDVVHVHGYHGLAIGQKIKKKYQIPVVYTEHSSNIAQNKLNIIEQILIRKYSNWCEARVSVSHFLASKLQNIVHTSVGVIPNTIDFTFFYPSKEKASDQWIMINLLNKNKQVDLGIQSFHHYRKKHKNAVLHIIGDGDERQNLERVAVQLGIQQAVFFHGESSMVEWIHILKSSKGLLLLSRSETFGVVALEALACNVPVIALNNEGIHDIINQGDIDILPVNANFEAISQAMDSLSFDSNRMNSIRTRLQSKFDYKVVAKLYLNLYSRILC